ncbi:HlyD family secretion protein [Cognatiyoonia koreensis]|uniref:HlyD family secretion protein n=1 Tax=Cognatiyoonia koreensis TaxID=364200 RepID=A0A1I0QHX9_9RHOB|nr:HlyD family efflux transporter periplasmic adaptor subunit [Cognatiyoonia koreensis]SEW26478.1 HlyD family secretion protein [Cognatiyoonia koreensis]
MHISPRNLILSGLGLAVVASLAYVSFKEDVVPVDLATVAQGPMEITIDAEGRTQIRDLYEVSAPIAGIALRSPVSVGDKVTAQETIVAIVQPAASGLLDQRTRLQAEAALQEALAARHAAEADLAQAEETRKFAQSQIERTTALVNSGVASITRLEDNAQQLAIANASVEAATARLEMAQGTIERAQASLVEPGDPAAEPETCCVTLKAPADGVILSVAAMSERPVAIGTLLVSIGDPENLELVAEILSSDAVGLEPGAHAHVERWGGSMPLLARLDRIDPKAHTKVSALGIEEQRVDAYFTLLTPYEERRNLGDGFSVFLRIVAWQTEDAIQIPLSAVFRDGEGWAVFVAENGVAHLRTVELGQRNGRMSEVLRGLSPGEKAVTHPSDAITEGTQLIERSAL